MAIRLGGRPSVDGLGVKLWTYGNIVGDHVKVWWRPRSYADTFWMVQWFDGRKLITTSFPNGKDAAARAANRYLYGNERGKM